MTVTPTLEVVGGWNPATEELAFIPSITQSVLALQRVRTLAMVHCLTLDLPNLETDIDRCYKHVEPWLHARHSSTPHVHGSSCGPHQNPGDRYCDCHPRFTDEKMEAPTGQAICPKSQRQRVVKPGCQSMPWHRAYPQPRPAQPPCKTGNTV